MREELEAWRADEPDQSGFLRRGERGDVCPPRPRRAAAGRLPARRERNEAEAEAGGRPEGRARRRACAVPARPHRGRLRRADGRPAPSAAGRGARRCSRRALPRAGAVARAAGAERARALPDKEGVEIAQGLFLSFVLASPRCGAHLVWSMLRPTEAALARLDEFRATGRRRPRRDVPRAPWKRGVSRDPERPSPERGGLRHAADHRGGGRPGVARPRSGGGRHSRLGRQSSALRRPARLRRGAQPHASVPRPPRLPLLRHA